MDLGVLISTFGLVGVAELGDKSMFAVIALAARYGRRGVFFGAVSALFLLSVIAALLGATVSNLVDDSIIVPMAALVFLAYGSYMLVKKEDETEEVLTTSSSSGFFATFSLITLMEMGDKTQIAIFTLAASTGEALAVIAGASLAFIVMVAIEVYLGQKISTKVSPQTMRSLAGAVFLLFGFFYLLQWLL